MANKPKIRFPLDGDQVAVSSDPRVFIAQGRVPLDPGAFPVGVNGHLLTPGTNTVKAIGSLIAWHRSGRKENVFHWALLFELGDQNAVADGSYDLLVSTYTGSANIKTATENNSSSKSEGVVLVTSAGLGIGVTFPAQNVQINGNQFIPFGSYTQNHKPDRASMTESSGASFSAGTVFGSGNPNGFWYAAFGPLPNGTYTLDVLSGTAASASVTGLNV